LQEIEFSSADVTALVLPEAGARLHRLRVFGQDVMRAPDDPVEHLHNPFFWGGYQMAPWCNRITTRPVDVAGATVDLPANFRDGTAIHGQVYARPWEAGDHGWFHCSGGGDGWPWPYSVSSRIGVVGREVRIEQSVLNQSDGQMPAGVGLHLWFTLPVEVAIDADLVFESNADSQASPSPVRGEFDRRELEAMPPALDATWARLGSPPVRLHWPALGIAASMTAVARTSYIVAASPADLPAIAVEPQTHAPNGLRRLINGEPGALDLLDAGGTLTLETRLTFNRTEEETS
jgi:aldose 1-epimerase